MHYYQHHIGDFIKSTSFLTNEELAIYLKLIWIYYDSEGPIPDDINLLCMKTGARDNKDTVLWILNTFFSLNEDATHWVHNRCEAEITSYYDFINSKIKAGKASAAKRKKNMVLCDVEHQVNTCSTDVQLSTIHEPISNNHVVKQTRGSRLSTDFVMPDDWSAFCKQDRPDLNARQVFEQFKDYWIAQPGQKGVKMDWDATWRNWVRRQNAPKISSVDIARVTVPGSQERDPALVKLDQDSKIVAPPPADILAKLQQLKKVAP